MMMWDSAAPQTCYQPDMMLAAQQAAFVPQFQTCPQTVEQPQQKRQAKASKKIATPKQPQPTPPLTECSNVCPNCGANSWHNLRVRKSKMSLRCTSCSKSLNYNKDYIWNKLRCPEFHATNGVCTNGAKCEKMHIHYYKEPANASETSLNTFLSGFQRIFTKPIRPELDSSSEEEEDISEVLRELEASSGSE